MKVHVTDKLFSETRCYLSFYRKFIPLAQSHSHVSVTIFVTTKNDRCWIQACRRVAEMPYDINIRNVQK